MICVLSHKIILRWGLGLSVWDFFLVESLLLFLFPLLLKAEDFEFIAYLLQIRCTHLLIKMQQQLLSELLELLIKWYLSYSLFNSLCISYEVFGVSEREVSGSAADRLLSNTYISIVSTLEQFVDNLLVA